MKKQFGYIPIEYIAILGSLAWVTICLYIVIHIILKL